MEFIIVVLLTFLIIGAVFIVLTRVQTPRYRLKRENVVKLLRMVLEGTAHENDWNVFTGIPIRYDAELERIRQRCIAVEKEDYLGQPGSDSRRRHLFTENGLQKLRDILSDLEAQSKQP